jgi:hypothetical protein
VTFSPVKMAAQAQWYRERGDVYTAGRLEAKLVAVGRCKRCGRGLTDPTSVDRGIGPDCWQKGDRDE